MSNSNQITVNKSTLYMSIFALIGIITLAAAIGVFIFSKQQTADSQEKATLTADAQSSKTSALETAEKRREQYLAEHSAKLAAAQQEKPLNSTLPKESTGDDYVSAGTGGYIDDSDNVDPTTGEPIFWKNGKRVDVAHYSGSVKDVAGKKFYYVNGEKVSKYDWNLITNGYQDDPPAGTTLIQYDDMPADIQANLDELNESAVYQ